MMKGISYTTKDVERHQKQATRWRHPDKNAGIDHGFQDFQRAADVLKAPRLRKLYLEAVERELRVMAQCGEDIRLTSSKGLLPRQILGTLRRASSLRSAMSFWTHPVQ